MTIVILVIILALTAVLPLFVKKVENNLEIFLFIMGLAATITSCALNLTNITEIFENKLLYIITIAVLIVSFIFRLIEKQVNFFFDFLLEHMPLKLVVFILIVGLGVLSSLITAIVASLLLCELVKILPLDRKSTVKISITACFSIGLGAVLTPIGEPLSTIVVSKLHENFTYMIDLLGIYIIVGIVLLGVLGTFCVDNNWREKFKLNDELNFTLEKETNKTIIIRAVKIFVFVIGLELLGFGFKPVIDTYVIHWNDTLLYFANMVSAILDNATLAAAEISPAMVALQIKAILMGLLISGGMLVTGNIPNIVTAGKLKISMREWAKYGLPIGLVLMAICYVVLFFVKF
jgi:predicted cation transporter